MCSVDEAEFLLVICQRNQAGYGGYLDNTDRGEIELCRSGERLPQTEGTTSVRALRQEYAWHVGESTGF